MNYTAPELITIIIAIGGLATIVGGVMVSVIMALKKKVEDTAAKTDVILGHVNSKQAEHTSEIKSLQEQLKFAKEVMAERKEVASLLAQSAATQIPSAPNAEIQKVEVTSTEEKSIPVKPQP